MWFHKTMQYTVLMTLEKRIYNRIHCMYNLSRAILTGIKRRSNTLPNTLKFGVLPIIFITCLCLHDFVNGTNTQRVERGLILFYEAKQDFGEEARNVVTADTTILASQTMAVQDLSCHSLHISQKAMLMRYALFGWP
ncbi:5'-bis(diphosphate) 3'-pyrophosphohydrolase MESH1,Guanosine-3' [Trichinella pseudospiralis]